jgi:hypothetical protein
MGLAGRGTFGEMMELSSLSIMTPSRSPFMIHPTPIQTLLTTTFESLAMQLSGLLARGARLLERFVHAESTPEITMAFERELSDLALRGWKTDHGDFWDRENALSYTIQILQQGH